MSPKEEHFMNLCPKATISYTRCKSLSKRSKTTWEREGKAVLGPVVDPSKVTFGLRGAEPGTGGGIHINPRDSKPGPSSVAQHNVAAGRRLLSQPDGDVGSDEARI